MQKLMHERRMLMDERRLSCKQHARYESICIGRYRYQVNVMRIRKHKAKHR